MMKFTTRLTILFALVLAAFVLSTLPVTAALFREAETRPAWQAWDRVANLWAELPPATQKEVGPLMDAVSAWKASAAASSLEGDARYVRFQTAFLMFSTVQALVLLTLVVGGLRLLAAPVRRMGTVVERLKSGDTEARLPEGGGPEWRDLARQFNSMLDQNRTLNRLQGWQEVAAFLSHQIKNPLTSMALAEQNVRALAPDLPALAGQNLDVIAAQVRRINNLVKRLRDLTSFEQMVRVPVDFSVWVDQWVASRRREGESWTVALDPVGVVPLVTLLAEQALDNLLTNSREAWSGAPGLALNLTVRRSDRWVTVEWSDSNRLPEGASWQQIGQPRFTTKKEGSGLGVFFVRRVAELHGGTLTITSPSGGLLFTLILEGGPHGSDSGRR